MNGSEKLLREMAMVSVLIQEAIDKRMEKTARMDKKLAVLDITEKAKKENDRFRRLADSRINGLTVTVY